MLKTRSPQFRVWFVLFLGIAGPGVMALLGKTAAEVFTLDSLLELLRICIGGAFAAVTALYVERPRRPGSRTRQLDNYDARLPERRG